jgi:hypothetical protein
MNHEDHKIGIASWRGRWMLSSWASNSRERYNHSVAIKANAGPMQAQRL